MSTTIKNIKIPYPTEGMIRSANLNDTVTPENSVQLVVNGNFDRVGAIQTRPGVTIYGTQLAKPVLAMGSLMTSTGGYILVQQENSIYSWNGSIWRNYVAVTSTTNKMRFAQFLGNVLMVNGNTGIGGQAPQQVYQTFSSAFTTSPNNMPAGDFISAGFEGRVWIVDASTDTIYFSDIVQFTPPSTYTLTFTLATNFIKNFSPMDGESITGLMRVPRALLVFKQNHIYRIYGATSSDAYPAYNVGTYSQESIIQAKDGIYFHHSSGFYKFDYGGQPIEISRRVIDFVKAIPRSNWANINGTWDGYDAVKWAVGPITVEGTTYTNCVMRYTISTQVWTIYDYPGYTITAMLPFDSTTTKYSFMGTSTGLIGDMDNGITDFGNDIYYDIIDRWRSFTDMYAKSKSLSGMNVYTENAGGMRVEYQTEKTQPNVWEYIDTVTEQWDALFPNASTKDFAGIRLRYSGRVNGTPIIYHGTEVLSIQDKGFEQN